ncbi:MAG: C-GCAxxG-C-C family protein [Clostridia bacterium]|nr:C-GCAxxG-C-C family protein [Clostridia bacterium]
MGRAENAVEYFSKGFNCSQAVLSAYCEEFGLDMDTAMKVSCAFGSGMKMGETCGAVTGALMVIGLKFGQAKENDWESKEKTYAMVREFIKRYKEINNSVICRELLNCDISTEEGMKEAREKEYFRCICPRLVSDAVKTLESML